MQTNDFNRLIGTEGDALEGLRISQFLANFQPTKEELKAAAQTINPMFLKTVRADVEKFQKLGKPRRWIRRYIKRKYNITEY